MGACEIAFADADVSVLELRGEVDLSLAKELASLLEEAARQSSVVLVDMSRCTFIDSSIIATLLGHTRPAPDEDSKPVAVIAPAEAPMRVLEISGAVDVLPVFPSADAARAELLG
jgi:anti-anti-sigma factor